jgi:hypothetical protein
MPVPVPFVPQSSPVVPDRQPYYVRDRQPWAITQEIQRHDEALYSLGEYAAFALMWHEQDFTAGRVGRCPTCFLAEGRVAKAYGQGDRNRCPDCFGTTFEGGLRALIFRPALFTEVDEDEQKTARGIARPAGLNVESTQDFRILHGDYVFRANGHRYQLRVPERVTLRTGFGTPYQSTTSIGYNVGRAALEDVNASVAYDIPPTATTLRTILSQGRYVPFDFSAYEQVHAPLIPTEDD